MDFTKKILPLPQHIKLGEESLVLNKDVKISIEGENEPSTSFPSLFKNIQIDFLLDPNWNLHQFSEKIQQWLNVRAEELQSRFLFQSSQFQVRSSTQKLSVGIEEQNQIPPNYRRQAYILLCNDSFLEIYAWTLRGAYYGIRTLTQMMHITQNTESPRIQIPMVTIADYPQYEIRGLVDDISRGQRPTIENFKQFIRFLSNTKQNFLVLYLEDMFYWEKHPKIGENRGRLTKADIKTLEAYAKEWFVNIIPGVEMLGHFDNILTDPAYFQFAEFPGAQCLNISDPKTKVFVDELLSEIVPAFECPIFAPICDESHDMGRGLSYEYVKTIGMDQAIADWYLFLIDEIKKYGKQAVLFAHDVIIKYPRALDAILEKKTAIYYWEYENWKTYPKISKLVKHGFPVIGGPAVFDWSRHFPYFDFAEVNMIEMAKDGVKRGLFGLVTTKWGDFFNENFRNNIFYGLAVNAQAAWTPFQSFIPTIRHAFAWNFYGTLEYTIMHCLNTLSQQNVALPSWPNGMFNRFWLDPFVREISKQEYEDAIRFMRDGLEVLETLHNLKINKTVKLNADNIEYMAMSAKLICHYGTKILLAEAVYRDRPDLAKKVQSLLKYEGDAIKAGFLWLRNDVIKLKEEYQNLWCQIAVKEGLEYPLEHFKILKWHYEEAIKDLETGRKPQIHQLPAQWIWRSGHRNNPNWGNQVCYYFFKEFLMTKSLKRAILQGIAGNHMKIYINGEYIGEVLSRFSMSQYPMSKAVQWFEVTHNIHSRDKNVICIEGTNWLRGIGGINAMLHLEFIDGTYTDIITDSSWKYSSTIPPGWPTVESTMIEQTHWKPVQSFGSSINAWRGPITVPVWESGQKSSISYVFGGRDPMETRLASAMGDKLYFLILKIILFVAKKNGVDMFQFRDIKPNGKIKLVP